MIAFKTVTLATITVATFLALVLTTNPHQATAQDSQNIPGDGPAVHGSIPWNLAGQTGERVKIGIIDVGFEGISALLGSEVPEEVTVRCYIDDGVFTANIEDCENGEGHGSATAETVIDIAPEATIYLANPATPGDLLATTEWMVSEGVSIINHSAIWGFADSGDGTPVLPDSTLISVDLAVENGITWVNSAGNQAEVNWFGRPNLFIAPDYPAFRFHSFSDDNDPPLESFYNNVHVLAGTEYIFELRWDDSWGGATTDLDLLLWDYETGFYLEPFQGRDLQFGLPGDYPLERVRYTARKDQTIGIVVRSFLIDVDRIPEWMQVWNLKGASRIEHFTRPYSIASPADSSNAGLLAVGASPHFDTHNIARYSSQGPTTDERPKPDIVGADCGVTVIYSDPPYCGTSQAAPHVAGMAALVRQRFPELGPVEVAEYLKGHAIQREEPDPNNTWGHGFAVLPLLVLCSNNPGLASDCDALLAARDTLAGTGTLNWSANVPIEDWDGVMVGGSPLRVTELRLPDRGLSGEIPAGLGGLSSLHELWLSENQLTGEIPIELGNLTNLVELVLWDNELSGAIPAELGSLSNLELLSISQNQLTGEIPAELGNLADLRRLSLWENQLTGEIPAELGSLANLEELWISENQLSGEIPAGLGGLANLEELWLSENQLTGEIPVELGNLSNLVELVIWGNELSGAIPTQLGGLSNLKELSLERNQLTGPIPVWLGNLTNLKELSLTRNQLTGEIPAGLGGLANLEELWLSENQLTGEIPVELAGLTRLEILALGGNGFIGTIPTWLGGLANLEELYLWGNGLTGTIPAELGSLADLRRLSLRDNQLTGEIPEELGSLANLERLRLHNNQLTGEIPAELGSLANLQQLRLDGNQLTGEIPSELGRLMNLVVLHLSGNQLTGCVPASWRAVEDNDLDQLGLSFCDPVADLISRYDANGNGVIDIPDILAAISAYQGGDSTTTISDILMLINLYQSG